MKTKAEQIYEAIGEGFGFNGSKDQCIEVIENILNKSTPPDTGSLPLLNALGDLLSGDLGCPMCDNGILRDPDKEHWDDCKWHNAQKVYERYRKHNQNV